MSATTDELVWLQSWYAKHCDGVWEHTYGVAINTLDNPGWSVSVDLNLTELENQTMKRVDLDNGQWDWHSCWLEAGRFQGRGDPAKLAVILRILREWATGTTGK